MSEREPILLHPEVDKEHEGRLEQLARLEADTIRWNSRARLELARLNSPLQEGDFFAESVRNVDQWRDLVLQLLKTPIERYHDAVDKLS